VTDASQATDRTVSTEVRLDVWLDVSCLFKTRSDAKKACTAGRIVVNGQPAKPHRPVRSGDEITISRPYGRSQIVVVRAVAERPIPKADARALYEDRTPPPTPEELEMRRMDRLLRSMHASPGAPDKRDRRALRRLRGRQA
jgi:ribosome-associated heat shock protein Hsp15